MRLLKSALQAFIGAIVTSNSTIYQSFFFVVGKRKGLFQNSLCVLCSASSLVDMLLEYSMILSASLEFSFFLSLIF